MGLSLFDISEDNLKLVIQSLGECSSLFPVACVSKQFRFLVKDSLMTGIILGEDLIYSGKSTNGFIDRMSSWMDLSRLQKLDVGNCCAKIIACGSGNRPPRFEFDLPLAKRLPMLTELNMPSSYNPSWQALAQHCPLLVSIVSESRSALCRRNPYHQSPPTIESGECDDFAPYIFKTNEFVRNDSVPFFISTTQFRLLLEGCKHLKYLRWMTLKDPSGMLNVLSETETQPSFELDATCYDYEEFAALRVFVDKPGGFRGKLIVSSCVGSFTGGEDHECIELEEKAKKNGQFVLHSYLDCRDTPWSPQCRDRPPFMLKLHNLSVEDGIYYSDNDDDDDPNNDDDDDDDGDY